MESETITTKAYADILKDIKSLKKDSVSDVLAKAEKEDILLFQPRCGVGDHEQMIKLLEELEEKASPDILSLTIDSYTRLEQFESASKMIQTAPEKLNGYPLVSHGWEKARELNERIKTPIEIRHGSPIAVTLFHNSLSAGFTSFEGGGIGYNAPYCKDVPLHQSLHAWERVDRLCGELAKDNVLVDRELFGTLTAVLVPPAISLASTLLEAILADRAGVKCLSIAYPQSGEAIQDIAALKAIKILSKKYLSPDLKVYPVFHEFMGAFPKDETAADSLIFYGSLVAKKGGARKIITKSNHEAFGIPTVDANAAGIRTAKMAEAFFYDSFEVNQEKVEEEIFWILKEVEEIVTPVLQSENLIEAIDKAFLKGTLDIPFATSRFIKSQIMPARDPQNAIRLHGFGNLPLSEEVKKRHRKLLGMKKQAKVMNKVFNDIFLFAKCQMRLANKGGLV